jgi:hypothetical protein
MLLALAVAALTVALIEMAGAASVTVAWTFATRNTDGSELTDLAGAKVYYGTASSNYTHVVTVPGGVPGGEGRATVTGLTEGVAYYLTGTAYNTAGLESDFANEIRVTAGRRDDGAVFCFR